MFTFTVRPDGLDEFEAKATSRDVVKWEAGGKGRSVTKLTENLHMGDLYDLAFVACQRQGLFDGDIREFRDSVDLDFQEDEEADPTRPAP